MSLPPFPTEYLLLHDTFLESPLDIVDWERAPSVSGPSYRAAPRSVVVLFASGAPPA
jgi:hypothetical protein